jgi:hypothetical protein
VNAFCNDHIVGGIFVHVGNFLLWVSSCAGSLKRVREVLVWMERRNCGGRTERSQEWSMDLVVSTARVWLI